MKSKSRRKFISTNYESLRHGSMPMNNYDKQKFITRTKANFGGGI